MTTGNALLQLIRDRRQTGPVETPDEADPRLPKLDGIRAVVFDVYGTLFSSGVGDISLAAEQDRDAALRATLTDNGIRISDTGGELRLDERFLDVVKAHQSDRRAEGLQFPEVDIRSVWRDFLAELSAEGRLEPPEKPGLDRLAVDFETRVNPVQPMPGVAGVLAGLRARELTLGIISNAQFFTPLLFEAFLDRSPASLGFCPTCSVWSYAILEAKPSRAIYEQAAAALKAHHRLKPAEVLYVGNDVRNDIRPAQAVGFRTALFAGDRLSLRRRTDDPDCRKVTADAELTELRQLGRILDGRN